MRQVISGEMLMARIPDSGKFQPLGHPMNRSPSIGLTWDEVTFGAPFKDQVRYRIWGEKQDPLVFRNLLDQPAISAYGLSRTRRATGSINIDTILPRQGIVRTFLAAFNAEEVLASRKGYPVVHLYNILEVGVSNLPFPTFKQMNEFNQYGKGVRAKGLNLCEMQLLTAATANSVDGLPDRNFDGGLLSYDPANGESRVTITAPRGIAPCYEVITEGGARVFWIYAPPGVNVTCGGSALTTANPSWQKSGVSGIASPNTISLASIIQA
jgi:hypothetical protein